jgi:hypothetical protein
LWSSCSCACSAPCDRPPRPRRTLRGG